MTSTRWVVRQTVRRQCRASISATSAAIVDDAVAKVTNGECLQHAVSLRHKIIYKRCLCDCDTRWPVVCKTSKTLKCRSSILGLASYCRHLIKCDIATTLLFRMYSHCKSDIYVVWKRNVILGAICWRLLLLDIMRIVTGKSENLCCLVISVSCRPDNRL